MYGTRKVGYFPCRPCWWSCQDDAGQTGNREVETQEAVTPNAERDNYAQVVLEERLRDALERLNRSGAIWGIECPRRLNFATNTPNFETKGRAVRI